jgi:transposase
MRYELTDSEWNVIKTMLPNEPWGVRRVGDRRVGEMSAIGAQPASILLRVP